MGSVRERVEAKDDRFFRGLRVLTPAEHRELHRQEGTRHCRDVHHETEKETKKRRGKAK